MKKIICVILSVIMTMSICGCGKKESKNDDMEISSVAVEEKSTTKENASENEMAEEILAMSNYMNGQNTVIDGVWMYGVSYDSNGQGVLSKIKKDGTEKTRLTKCFPGYINIIDGWIYYLGYSRTDKSVSIRKVRVSGKNEEILIKSEKKNEIMYMFIYNNKIYYSENYEPEKGRITGRFCSADLNGKNVKVILKKAVYFPYIVNGKLYYQDDNDKARLHVCDMNGSNDKVLIDKCVFKYVISGDNIYYMAKKKMPKFDKNCRIVNGDSIDQIIGKCRIDGSKDEIVKDKINVIDMMLNESSIYYTDDKDDSRLYVIDIESGHVDLISQDTNVTNIALFDDGIYYYDYDKDCNYIDNMYFADLDGTNKRKIFED